MLQRSPTYFRTGRNAIELAEKLRRLQVKEEWIHEIVRRKILFEQDCFTRRSFSEPERVKKELLGAVRAVLAGAMTSTSTSRRATGRGGSASPSCPTPICSRRSRAARPRSSPTRSTASPRRASCSSPARRWRPTSSSPRPASTSVCSATSLSRSTASRSISPIPSPIAA